jgi:hypothetical protein
MHFRDIGPGTIYNPGMPEPKFYDIATALGPVVAEALARVNGNDDFSELQTLFDFPSDLAAGRGTAREINQHHRGLLNAINYL